MNSWQAILLGIVQGATEFLPVSSTGHLVIVQHWLGITEGTLAFDTFIHFGSLLAVLYVFRGELLLIVKGFFGFGDRTERAEGRRLLGLLVIATLPLIVVGLLFRDMVEEAFSSIYVAPMMLVVTGVLLWIAEARQSRLSRKESANRRHALWMGLGQAAAVLPGLSRSGTSIAVGMLAGLTRERAARFSFLMAIPAILGATILEVKGMLEQSAAQGPGAMDAGVIMAGVVASAIASYGAIVLLLRFLEHGRLLFFAYYTWALAAVTLFLAWRGS